MKQKFSTSSPTTKADGRTLTFLANSGLRMVNNLTVDLTTLKAPLLDGSLMLVKDLTEDDQLALPLLVDHNPSIDSQAGTISRLWLADEGLMAEALLSKVDQGERIRQLAEDHALTNSFSITIEGPKPDKDGILRDAELVEISVVYRGADPKASFRSLNARNGGTKLDNLTGIIKKFNLAPDEAAQLTSAITDILQDALDAIADKIDDKTKEPEPTNQPTKPEEPVQSSNNRVIINKAGTAQQTVASFSKSRETWLDSKDALAQFERVLLQTDNQGIEAFKKTWRNTVAENMNATASFGVDNVDYFIPTEAVTTIADAINTRGSGLWDLLRKTGLERITIGGNTGGLTDATRAHGYPVSSYGTTKTEQAISFVKRELSADYTYKYIKLNKGDIRRTQKPGTLIKYILEELPNYIIQTIERQITLGGYTDMAHFRAITTDANDSSGEWAGSNFALTHKMSQSTTLMDFVQAAYEVRAMGEKVLVCNPATVAEMLMSANAEGNTFIALGNKDGLATALGVSKIITPEWWTAEDDKTTKGIILVPSHYSVVGDTSIEAFTNFALQTNTNEYLQEIYAGGGLDAEKSAVVITPKK